MILFAILQYFIAIKQKEGTSWENLQVYAPLYPPKDRYYADPFLFKHQGITYLFFENYNYRKGVISWTTLNKEGKVGPIRLALELPIHLSFPYVFEDKGDMYIMPETYRYRSVNLYKSITFPIRWKHVRALVTGEAFSDPILFKHEGYYWLFAAIHMDQLVIYYAKDLDGEFTAHPVNAKGIKGRNAGGVFYEQGKMIRPTMDLRESYGRAMVLKEIVRLTPEEFIEQEIAHIEPNWAPDLVGTHTFCLSDDFIVYDGLK